MGLGKIESIYDLCPQTQMSKRTYFYFIRTQTSSLVIYIGGMKTNHKTENMKNAKENYPTSQRKCEIGGKRFLVIRHFVGDKDLSTLMAGIAAQRANREMGI